MEKSYCAEKIYLFSRGTTRNSRLFLTSPDGCIASCGNPTWCTVCSQAQNPVRNNRVIHLVGSRGFLPVHIKAEEPDMVGIFSTVRVNVEIPNARVQVRRGGVYSTKRVRAIPGGDPRRTRWKRSILFNGNNAGRSTGCGCGIVQGRGQRV